MLTSPLLRRLYLVAAGAALVTALMLAANRTDPPAEPAPDTTETDTAPTTDAAATPVAYVGEWEGRLAVFRTGSTTPDEVYDVFVAVLPQADQTALQQRIPVADEEELQKLLEDFSG